MNNYLDNIYNFKDSNHLDFTEIFIRDDLNINEIRTPLIPSDIKKLIEIGGFTIYVQSSNKRIYCDSEYEKCGAIITTLKWYDDFFNNKKILIIGIKGIDNEYQYLNNHRHMYFSHSFKNQCDADIILKSFKNSDSIIYDFEYFSSFNGIKYGRLISFGFYSGIVGGFLGVLFRSVYLLKKDLNCDTVYDFNILLKPWLSIDSMILYLNNIVDNNDIDNNENDINNDIDNNENDINNDIDNNENDINNNISIGIIGANGRCGSGVKYILDKLGLKYTVIDRNYDKTKFIDFDIFYNCILLDTEFSDTFFDINTKFYKDIFIVDISCDNNAPNNPIKLYKENTTWENPIIKYGDFCKIISISNLPSLLPKDSSDYFSNICCDLLLYLEKNNNKNTVKDTFKYTVKDNVINSLYGNDQNSGDKNNSIKIIINQAWNYSLKNFFMAIQNIKN
jgi:saccharopine dehydrogenase (NAD+, L-lysine-forming)